jgi:hypothetical protein
MIRFAWLQFRTQALVVFGALAGLAIVLVATGPHLAHLYDTTVRTCASEGNCGSATDVFLQHDAPLRGLLDIFTWVVPVVLGVFWGAPLVARELEQGTFRLAWTQSVTRSRWLAAKLALGALASMAVAGLLSFAVTWWSSPFDRITVDRFAPDVFSERGIVAIGYAAFAFMLGVAAGVVIRRTLPAMAVTLVGFVAVRQVFTIWVRSALVAPSHLNVALNAQTPMGFAKSLDGPLTLNPQPPDLPNAWVYSTHIVDEHGRALTADALSRACPGLGQFGPPGPPSAGGARVVAPAPQKVIGALQDCIVKLGSTYHEVVAYQPANRFWTFQWIELGIFVAAAALLAGLCFWWVRRRLV